MANQYAPPPPGKIWVPTPTGNVAMTLDEARAYQASHRYAVTDPNNPNLTPEVRAELQDPRMQAAIAGQQTTKVRVHDTIYTLDHGRVVGMEQGGHGALSPLVWAAKHPKTTLALMAAPVAAPYAISALGGGGTVAGTAGTSASTTGTTTAAGVLPATTTVPLATGTITGVPASGAVPAAFGAAAAPAAATGATSLLPSTTTVPTSTGTIAGVPSSGLVRQAMQPRSWLSGIGNFLGSEAGEGVIRAGTGLAGAAIASGGLTKAAEIQAQTAREALAYEKQRDQYAQQLEASRYGDLSSRLQPYIATGQSASDRMAQILGLDPSLHGYTPPTTAPARIWPSVTGSETGAIQPTYDQRGPGTPGSVPSGLAVPRPGMAGQTVLLRAPDGSTKAVSADEAQHYLGLGAQVVNG